MDVPDCVDLGIERGKMLKDSSLEKERDFNRESIGEFNLN